MTQPSSPQRFQRALFSLLSLQAEEAHLALLMLAFAFFGALGNTYALASANTLFLSRFELLSLPYLYVLLGLFAPLFARLHDRFARRRSQEASFVWMYLFFTAATLVSWVGLLWHMRWFYPAFYVLACVCYQLHLMLFWILAGRIYTIRQSKRLYGLFIGGFILGEIFGGFSTDLIVASVHIENVPLVIAACYVCVVVFVVRIGHLARATREATSATAAEVGDQEHRRPSRFWHVLRIRLVLLICVIAAFTTLAYYFLDYQFMSIVKASYREEDLALFFGSFYAVTGLVTLFVQFFVTSRLLTRFGVVVSLLILPACLLFGAGAILSVPTGMLFGALVTLSFFRRFLDMTIADTSFNLLFQPLPSDLREPAQKLAYGFVVPVITGVAGVGLLFLQRTHHAGIYDVSIAFLVIVALWNLFIFLNRRVYTNALRDSLQDRSLSPVDFEISDPSILAALHSSLESDDEKELLFALSLAGRLPTFPQDLHEPVAALLHSASSQVRQTALQVIEVHRLAAFSDEVLALLEEPDRAVQAQAIHTYCLLYKEDHSAFFEPFLHHAHMEVRIAATVGLIEATGVDGILRTVSWLKELEASDEPAERIALCRILEQVAIQQFFRPLLSLLKDPATEVRLRAIHAARAVRHPRLLEPLCDNLMDDETRGLAIEALIAWGPACVPSLSRLLQAQTRWPVLSGCVSALSMIDAPKAAEALLALIETGSSRLRAAALHAILQSHLRFDFSLSAERTEALLSREWRHALDCVAQLSVLASRPPLGMLQRALASEFEDHKKRLFAVLMMKYRPSLIRKVHTYYSHASAALSANALELLDAELQPEDKRRLLPLFDRLSFAHKLKLCERLYRPPEPSVLEIFSAVLQNTSETTSRWSLLCALYLAPLSTSPSLGALVLPFLSHDDATVRETALYTLHKHQWPALPSLLPTFLQDASPSVRLLSAQLLQEPPPTPEAPQEQDVAKRQTRVSTALTEAKKQASAPSVGQGEEVDGSEKRVVVEVQADEDLARKEEKAQKKQRKEARRRKKKSKKRKASKKHKGAKK